MKTRYIKLICAVLGIMCANIHAGMPAYNQVWQMDINNYWTGFPDNMRRSTYKVLSNKNIAYAEYDSTNSYIVVIDPSDMKSVFKVKINLPNEGWFDRFEIKGAIGESNIVCRVGEKARITKRYELTGTNYTEWSSSIPGLTISYDSSNGENEQKYDYARSGRILTKYERISTSQAPRIQEAAMGLNGDNFIISWDSEINSSYRVEFSSNLVDWVSTDISLTGTGGSMTWANVVTDNSSYYRLIRE